MMVINVDNGKVNKMTFQQIMAIEGKWLCGFKAVSSAHYIVCIRNGDDFEWTLSESRVRELLGAAK